MKKIVRIIFACAVVALLAAPVAFAAEQVKKAPQTNCPVMDSPINKEIYVDYQGKRIYFCCKSCPEKFNKDPGKYMKKLQDQGVSLDETPK